MRGQQSVRTRDFLSLFAWEVINPVLLQVKRQRVYDFNEGFHGVNLGCGLDTPPQWIGVDGGITHVFAHTMPAPIVKAFFPGFRMAKNYSADEYIARIKATRIIHYDLSHGIPFRTGTVPNVYSSHFFEHLTRSDASRLLKECHRVLRSGGIIRICVPSLETEADRLRAALLAYETGDIEPIQRWVTDSRSGFLGPYSRHRWMYNVADLSAALSAAGFTAVIERAFREGRIPDVEQLDTRSGIYVEATRRS